MNVSIKEYCYGCNEPIVDGEHIIWAFYDPPSMGIRMIEAEYEVPGEPPPQPLERPFHEECQPTHWNQSE